MVRPMIEHTEQKKFLDLARRMIREGHIEAANDYVEKANNHCPISQGQLNYLRRLANEVKGGYIKHTRKKSKRCNRK
jgi:hypothetical protein